MKFLIKNGRVIDPANQIDDIRNIFVADGFIADSDSIASSDQDVKVIDAEGLIVTPGFIDMHVHLREPGQEYKEDITTGSWAAAAGGFTAVCCMPNTDPVIDNHVVASFIKERARKSALVKVFPVGAITKNLEGEKLSEIAGLVSAGCVAISDDGNPVKKANMMRNGLEYAKMFDLPVLSHCEEENLSSGGLMHEGLYSFIYGLKGIPAAAEAIMVGRDISLARLTGSRLHICHISAAESVDLVRQAKKEGLPVTCEVTPHHLALSDKIIGDYDGNTKVNPPLRGQDHIDALIAAVKDGTIDCIATDHAPHHIESKDCEFQMASFGISGLETAVAVCMDMVNRGVLELKRVIEMFTLNPANILRLNGGALNAGMPADITVIDLKLKKTVDVASFYSKGKNNPFHKKELTGWPVLTMVNGKIAAQNGKIII
ncbi:MAG: dihydroorotase [Syntrophomonadaceae bacterium]|jgi:dihydroorotase|nr:dihydroorotase [Syntrophomonadaceae bacterium]